MTDWSASMQQTFEFYEVDPTTWKDIAKLNNITSMSIDRDSTADTLGSATIDVTDESLTKEEFYVRAYLLANQNGVTERFALGTFLAQTPSISFDGRVSSYSLDAYTPLIELTERKPQIGYYTPKGNNILNSAYLIQRSYSRAPINPPYNEKNLQFDFVAEDDDTWLTYLKDLLSQANYELYLDEYGNCSYAPITEMSAMTPVFTYTDDNSSILYSDISLEKSYMSIPNVVTVVYSDSGRHYEVTVKNEDENSVTSIPRRGREIETRITDPSFTGEPTRAMVEEYAQLQLESLSSVTGTIKYKHGFNQVRVGDCVRINYTRAGIKNQKAKVTVQSFDCETGIKVSETAQFSIKYWER